MKLIVLTTLCFISSSHPMMMIMIMILSTLILNFYMYLYMKYSWFILMITLLILGGLLVIFLYITSLTPNKKFNFNKTFIIMIPLILVLKFEQIMNPSISHQILYLFTPLSLILLMLTIMYLMLTLISIMRIIKSSMAPMKSTN
nr:NADH dehydrogenase subunit 6 [Alectorobius microlophi]